MILADKLFLIVCKTCAARPVLGDTWRSGILTNCRVIGSRVMFTPHEGVRRQVSVCAVLGRWLIG